MTHMTEDWHNSPLPKGLTVPPGRGGGRSGGPSGQTRTGTQDGDLQSRAEQTDRDHGGAGTSGSHGGAGSSGGHGGAGSSGGHGGAGSSGSHGGAGSSGGHGGAGSSGGHGGAGSSGGHGGAGSSGGHGRSSSGPWPRSPRPGPYSRNPYYPPKKFPWGSQGVSGALRGRTDRTVQDRTGKPSGARQTGQDSPQEQEALLGKLGSWGFFWAWQDIRGPPKVPSATASTSATRGQAAGNGLLGHD